MLAKNAAGFSARLFRDAAASFTIEAISDAGTACPDTSATTTCAHLQRSQDEGYGECYDSYQFSSLPLAENRATIRTCRDGATWVSRLPTSAHELTDSSPLI